MSDTIVVRQAPSSDFNPENKDLRRQFIQEYLQFHSQWDQFEWESENHELVGAVYFEYAVDRMAWRDYFQARGLRTSDHGWPWETQYTPDPQNYSQGISEGPSTTIAVGLLQATRSLTVSTYFPEISSRPKPCPGRTTADCEPNMWPTAFERVDGNFWNIKGNRAVSLSS
ncbi:hypothetical protein NXS19_008490 [Fusarium pseudograminearum]|nr:hypothetical protein NXS19_008490 [Fusarium pseudograminearum]